MCKRLLSEARAKYFFIIGEVNSMDDPVMFTNKGGAMGKRQAFNPLFPDEIEYSDKYTDDVYEYRHVLLPKHIYKKMPRGRLLSSLPPPQPSWTTSPIEFCHHSTQTNYFPPIHSPGCE